MDASALDRVDQRLSEASKIVAGWPAWKREAAQCSIPPPDLRDLEVPVSGPPQNDPRDVELAALRARVEDLELIARAGIERCVTQAEDDVGTQGWDIEVLGTYHLCPDDGTGLPLLTAEARRALRGMP